MNNTPFIIHVSVCARSTVALTVPRRTHNMLRYTHLDSPAYIELGCFSKFCIIVSKLHLCIQAWVLFYFCIALCVMTRCTLHTVNVIIIHAQDSLNTGRVFKKIFKDGRSLLLYCTYMCKLWSVCMLFIWLGYMADGFFLPLILNVSLYMYISGVKVHAATTHTRARDKA